MKIQGHFTGIIEKDATVISMPPKKSFVGFSITSKEAWGEKSFFNRLRVMAYPSNTETAEVLATKFRAGGLVTVWGEISADAYISKAGAKAGQPAASIKLFMKGCEHHQIPDNSAPGEPEYQVPAPASIRKPSPPLPRPVEMDDVPF